MKSRTWILGRSMKSSDRIIAILLLAALVCLSASQAATGAGDPTDLPIVQKWSGDYPVVHLNRLPEGQTTASAGYIDDTSLFDGLWQVFKPDEPVPEVDFDTQMVVFCRNVEFYNHISIVKVTLTDGIAEIIAIETQSALPIEDKVAMAMAVIPRAGVQFIQVGTERMSVSLSQESAIDPLNATYQIEGDSVHLLNGRCELPAAPGSATKTRTVVLGKPVYGDMDGDGDEDAALILVHAPGGSGTFFYVAVALKLSGRYQGTNAVLLGDRIIPKSIGTCNAVVVVSYADRRPEEPMSARPSVIKSTYLILENDKREYEAASMATRLVRVAAPEGNCTNDGSVFEYLDRY